MILRGSYVCTQRIHWIYFEAFIAETYVQLATTNANVLCAQALCSETSYLLVCCPGLNWLANASHTVLCGDLYTACVDTSRMVFWDHSPLPKFHRCIPSCYTSLTKGNFDDYRFHLTAKPTSPFKFSQMHSITLHSIILLISSRKGCDTMLISILLGWWLGESALWVWASSPHKKPGATFVGLWLKLWQSEDPEDLLGFSLWAPRHVLLMLIRPWSWVWASSPPREARSNNAAVNMSYVSAL